MSALHMILEQTPNKRCMTTQDVLSKNLELLKQFPLPTYFQTHFQVIHQNIEANQKELTQIKRCLVQIEEQLGRLCLLLGTYETSNSSSSSH